MRQSIRRLLEDKAIRDSMAAAALEVHVPTWDEVAATIAQSSNVFQIVVSSQLIDLVRCFQRSMSAWQGPGL